MIIDAVQEPRTDRRRGPGARRRIRTGGLLVTAAVMLGLTLTACGGGDDEPSGGASAAPPADQLVQFSQCMRQNGVAEFPDPVDGKLNLQVTKGGPLDPSNAVFQSARDKCKTLEPPGVLGGGGQDTAQQEQVLKFVNCMRENGVPEMPDPQNGQFRISGDQVDPNSPAFQKAMQTCRDLIPGGGAVKPGGGQ